MPASGNTLVSFDIQGCRAEDCQIDVCQAAGEFLHLAEVSPRPGGDVPGNSDALKSLSSTVRGLGCFRTSSSYRNLAFYQDIDLFLTSEEVAAATCCLKKNGFLCRVKDPVWLHKAHRNGFFVDLITGMSNAVITVERSWIENAHPAMVLGVRTRVLAAEELLVSKLFVLRRERFDGADVAHIVYASRGALDWNRILVLVKEHWEMLLFALVLYRYVYPAYSHYVPSWMWRCLLGRFSEELLMKQNSSASFRGSLVDDKMFAIDVAEWGMEDILRVSREPWQTETKIKIPAAHSLSPGDHGKKIRA